MSTENEEIRAEIKVNQLTGLSILNVTAKEDLMPWVEEILEIIIERDHALGAFQKSRSDLLISITD